MAKRESNIFDSGLEIIRRTLFTYKNTAGSGSAITEIGKIGRFEPITLVSSNLKTLKELPDIQHGILNIVAAFYVQGITILATKMVDTRILSILDATNPDRDLQTITTALAIESFNSPVKEEMTEAEYRSNVKNFLALEALQPAFVERLKTIKYSKENLDIIEDVRNVNATSDRTLPFASNGEQEHKDTSAGAVSTAKVDYLEKTEKTVGKVIEVSMQVGPRSTDKVAVPIVIKLDNMIVPGEVLSNIITMNEESIRFGSRFKDAITGRIHPIKDFLLCNDLVKKQKENLIKDPTRAYASLLNRVNNSKLYSILSRNISLSTISGVLMLSEVEMAEVSKRIGGTLDNKLTRKKVFDNSSVMVIAVVDRTYEIVTIYVRDMDNYSEIKFSSFKESTTGNNNDALMEVFKSMSVGRVPTF